VGTFVVEAKRFRENTKKKNAHFIEAKFAPLTNAPSGKIWKLWGKKQIFQRQRSALLNPSFHFFSSFSKKFSLILIRL